MKSECLHAGAENYSASLQGYKIYKDQCVKCFH